MKVYVDNNTDNINIVQSVTSASTMISSLASEAKQYILSKFPKNFFRYIYIDTSETVIQQNRNDLYNPNANKIPYPSMAITPEISLDDPIAGMEKGLHLSSPNLYLRRDLNRTYNKIVVDPKDNFAIYYTSDYITTNFNFKVVTNSFIQNADISFFLKSKFQKDFFQFLNGRSIQSEIPKTFIKMIADLKNWNLNDPDEMDELRLYLIGTSKTPDAVQKRINLGTGKQCFFINERQNLLTLFRDLDCPASINREQQAEGDYTVTFTLQISCWIPNAYIMTIRKETLQRLNEEIIDAAENGEDELENGFYSTTVMTNETFGKKNVIEFTDSAGENQIGHLIAKEVFMYETNKSIPEIHIMDYMQDEFKSIYSYGLNRLHLNMSSLINIVIYSRDDRYEIKKDEKGKSILDAEGKEILVKKSKLNNIDDFKISYGNEDINKCLTVTINDPNYDKDIAVGIYLNRLLYETIKKALLSDKNYINDNYIASVLVSIAGQKQKVKVKGFINNRDHFSADINKSLRVKTAFGIGYISLLNDDEKDGYKICLGNDKNGKVIIKKFEIDSEE